MALEQWDAITACINGLTHRKLVVVGKALNGGRLGFDPQKESKDKLAGKVRNIAYQYAADGSESAFRSSGNDYKAARYDATMAAIQVALGGTDEVEPSSFDGEDTATPDGDMFEADTETDDAIKAAEEALKRAKAKAAQGPRLNVEFIRKIIVEEVAKQSKTYRVEYVTKEGATIPSDEKPRHAAFPELIQAVSRGLNVLLVGPAGVGKTHLGEQVAEALGRRFLFTGAVSSEYKLLGFLNAQGQTVRTPYREAYENGALFLWDEVDASDPQAMLSFNAGLANGHQDFPDCVVPRHSDFGAIMSANTMLLGQDRVYVGRNQLDGATCDRLYFLPVDPDPVLEAQLFGGPSPRQVPDVSKRFDLTPAEWLAYVQAARASVQKLAIRHIVSMRAVQQGVAMIGSGMSRASVERGALWKGLKAEDVAKIKSDMGV